MLQGKSFWPMKKTGIKFLLKIVRGILAIFASATPIPEVLIRCCQLDLRIPVFDFKHLGAIGHKNN